MGQLIEPRREVYISELEHDFIPFSELDEKIKEDVLKSYVKGWEHALYEEQRKDIFKTSIEEEVEKQFNSELYTKIFPKGQIVLVAEIEGKKIPVISTRSIIWKVLEIYDSEGTEFHEFWGRDEQIPLELLEFYFKNYPQTWYQASGYGCGFPKIQMIDDGCQYECLDYETILNSKAEENKKHDLVLINYAMTGNPDTPIKIRGSVGKAVEERRQLKDELGLIHCDTFTPLSGYDKWARENPDKPVQEYVKLLIEGKISGFDAALMHKKHGAEIMHLCENARHDPRSRNYCVITRYC